MSIWGYLYSLFFFAKIRRYGQAVIFGAGVGGGAAFQYLSCFRKDWKCVFADNNSSKWGRCFGTSVMDVKAAAEQFPEAVYILSFLAERKDREKQAYEQLSQLGISKKQIVVYHTYFLSDKYTLDKRVHSFYYFLKVCMPKARRRVDKITKIVTLTYGAYSPNGGCGGYRAGVSCQKTILGDSFEDIILEYGFGKENIFSVSYGNPWMWLLERIEYVRSLVKCNDNTSVVYIAHDFISAFALDTAGAVYRMVYHHQGSAIDERHFLGIEDSRGEKRLLKYMEERAFHRAYEVHFPSKGAAEAFFASKTSNVDRKKVRVGINLPVTVWGELKEEAVDSLELRQGELKILSIGQMSLSKGMDLIPKFLRVLLDTERGGEGRPVHWIAVGDGPLRDQVLAECEELGKLFSEFHFDWYKELSHENILYLHRNVDAYCMLQRISIFDISTLEAMKYGRLVLLSKMGGNLEYNLDNNIIFVEPNYEESAKTFIKCMKIKDLGEKNKEVFEQFFSAEAYRVRMEGLFTSWKEEAIDHKVRE